MTELNFINLVDKFRLPKDLIVLGEAKGRLFPVRLAPTCLESRVIISIYYYKNYCKQPLDQFVKNNSSETSTSDLHNFLNIVTHDLNKKIYGSIGLPEISYSTEYSKEPENIKCISEYSDILRLDEFLSTFNTSLNTLFFELQESTGKIMTTFINGIGLNKRKLYTRLGEYGPGEALVINTDYTRPICFNNNNCCDFSLDWGNLIKRKPNKYSINLLNLINRYNEN